MRYNLPEDYEIWNIDEVLPAYKNYPDWMEECERTYKALFLFLEKNGLLTCPVSNEQGEVIRRSMQLGDITDEGLLLVMGQKNAVDRWLDSKGSSKNPPDMAILEKALARFRG